MGIRIQPREIDVPEDNPFKNDLLGREESVKVLTHIVGSLEGPGVLAVDAAWGNGKPTFLNIWAQHLRNEGFPIVKFNAWETDFSGDPFVALSTELTEGLPKNYPNESMAQKVDDTKERAKEVLRQAVPGIIRLATAGMLNINPLLEQEVGQTLASYAEERLSAYREAQKSIKEFKRTLQNMADAVSQSSTRPLIVMIDELDRCRPSYAVELLEVAKHLFAVGHIVFVLAVNRSELAHSIRALYGDGFDAQGYLRRFFDVDFRLPEPDRKSFINELLASIKIDEYFDRTQDPTARGDYEVVKKWLQSFFHDPDLSLRRIAQAIHRLGLVFASLRSDQRSFVRTTVVCLILRTIDIDLYHRFVSGEVSDLDVVDKVFTRPGTENLKQRHERYLFEAVVIMAAREMASEDSRTPLWQRYRDLKNSEGSDNALRVHAIAVIQLVGKILFDRSTVEFRHSVQRIELLSTSLMEDSVTEQENS